MTGDRNQRTGVIRQETGDGRIIPEHFKQGPKGRSIPARGNAKVKRGHRMKLKVESPRHARLKHGKVRLTAERRKKRRIRAEYETDNETFVICVEETPKLYYYIAKSIIFAKIFRLRVWSICQYKLLWP